MIATLAYLPQLRVTICRAHYNDPPEGIPPLGAIEDSRSPHCGPQCEARLYEEGELGRADVGSPFAAASTR